MLTLLVACRLENHIVLVRGTRTALVCIALHWNVLEDSYNERQLVRQFQQKLYQYGEQHVR